MSTADPRDRDSKTCPYCAETIKAAAVKCRFCGSALAPDAAGGGGPPPPTAGSLRGAAGDAVPGALPDPGHDLRVASCGQIQGGFALSFAATDPARVASALDTFLGAEGYALEDGSQFDGVYGKGPRALSWSLGQWSHQRRKFHVAVQVQQGSTWVFVQRAMTGYWAAGVFGLFAMRRETQRLRDAMLLRFGSR